MKEKAKTDCFANKKCNKLLKIMKVSFLLLFFCIFTMTAENTYSQQAEVSLRLNNVTLKTAISEIEKESDYVFLIIDEAKNELDAITSINANKESISNILKSIFDGTGLGYNVVERQVSVYKDETNKKADAKTVVSAVAQQQKKKITGVILDDYGESVIGANIMEKGTSNGTVTDFDGNFTLEVANNATLQVSYIGYITQEINTAGKTSFNIILIEDTQALDEVVVVAYGEQKRSAFSGSAAVVSAESISRRPVSNVMNALEGMSAGVQVQTSSGSPTASPSFRIRGASSINAGTSPLIVLDGVPYEGGWNNINPSDVESVTVLKDAASTAIYGARGGNGVVLITSKKR